MQLHEENSRRRSANPVLTISSRPVCRCSRRCATWDLSAPSASQGKNPRWRGEIRKGEGKKEGLGKGKGWISGIGKGKEGRQGFLKSWQKMGESPGRTSSRAFLFASPLLHKYTRLTGIFINVLGLKGMALKRLSKIHHRWTPTPHPPKFPKFGLLISFPLEKRRRTPKLS